MRRFSILATLLGCQGVDEFRVMLGVALNFGVICNNNVYIVSSQKNHQKNIDFDSVNVIQ